jgi:ribosomal-protein-alanine N-acetyltransferase
VKPANCSIRWMITRDFPRVVEIDSSTPNPWTEDDLKNCLRMRNCIGMVAEWKDIVVGFQVYELWKDKFVILNLSVHPDWRRQGVGRLMLHHNGDRGGGRGLLTKLSPDRRTKIEVTVRDSNLLGQLFLKSQGFKAVQVLRGLYDNEGDTGEDGYLMEWRLPLPACLLEGVKIL